MANLNKLNFMFMLQEQDHLRKKTKKTHNFNFDGYLIATHIYVYIQSTMYMHI